MLSTHKRSLLELVQRAIVLRQGQVAVAGPLPSVVAGREVRLPPVKGSLTKEMAS